MARLSPRREKLEVCHCPQHVGKSSSLAGQDRASKRHENHSSFFGPQCNGLFAMRPRLTMVAYDVTIWRRTCFAVLLVGCHVPADGERPPGLFVSRRNLLASCQGWPCSSRVNWLVRRTPRQKRGDNRETTVYDEYISRFHSWLLHISFSTCLWLRCFCLGVAFLRVHVF